MYLWDNAVTLGLQNGGIVESLMGISLLSEKVELQSSEKLTSIHMLVVRRMINSGDFSTWDSKHRSVNISSAVLAGMGEAYSSINTSSFFPKGTQLGLKCWTGRHWALRACHRKSSFLAVSATLHHVLSRRYQLHPHKHPVPRHPSGGIYKQEDKWL